ncbi:WEB family protein [Carex littledalei]|uniref:WEB family protein n=1 Tax=Carex littledalei TaxID=544730 RepID=A0A833VE39_9POAL|nr:WEB family protein [Carex littledalei]
MGAKSGLFEPPSNKPSTPATPRRPSTPKTGRVNRSGSLVRPNSPSPTQNPRLSFDRSPKPTESKPVVDRKAPKTATPDKQLQPRSLKGSELQSQLDSANEELKKAKEQLAALEKEKLSILDELQEAKLLADATNGQLQDAIVARRRAEEATEIEKFRADELEQSSIDAAQTREDEWQSELERMKNQHASDISVLVETKEQLERVKHELEMSIEEKNAALGRAETAMQAADVNMEKAEQLSSELAQLKELLNSRLENKTNEAEEIITKLKETDVARFEAELTESNKCLEATRQEVFELETTAELLRNKLENSEEAKLEALTNEKAAISQIESLTEEKERMIAELEKIKLEEENNKKAMEDLASALHETSADSREVKENLLKKESDHEHSLAQIGDLKLALKNTKESYEIMLDEVNYEVVCLRKTVEKLETEAKAEQNDRELKENEVLDSKQQSEEEIVALKVELVDFRRDSFSLVKCASALFICGLYFVKVVHHVRF